MIKMRRIILLLIVFSLFLVACQQEKGPRVLVHDSGLFMSNAEKFPGMQTAYVLFNAGEKGTVIITTQCFDKDGELLSDKDSEVHTIDHEQFMNWYTVCPEGTASKRIQVLDASSS